MARRVRLPAALVLLAALTTASCGAAGSFAGTPAGTTPIGTVSSTTPASSPTTTTARPATSAPRPATSAPRPSPTTVRRPPSATRAPVLPPRTGSGSASASTLAGLPRQPAQPAVAFPANDAAVGTGANAVVTSVDDALWSRMVGYSWTSQCPVGRTGLKVVRVNFWGFDGKRSRGSVVVASAIAPRVAGAFSALYDQQFRIRQMRPMDSRWGHNPRGPGADDYAAMTADNTSAFNCRYVGGEEASKRWSRHSLGLAVDVNDFENPYVDSHGTVYPDTYFLSHRTGAGVFTGSSSAAVRAFTTRGLSWEGTSSPPDYQHFDG